MTTSGESPVRGTSAGDAPRDPDMRVIIVGRSRLDSSLRRDPRMELARVRTPLEAVGELADPIDDRSPARAAIILSPGSEPEIEGDSAGDFVDALHLIDPEAAILIETPGVSGRPAPPYDATIRSEASAEELREVLERVKLSRAGWIAPGAVPVGDPAIAAARAVSANRPGAAPTPGKAPASAPVSARPPSASPSPAAATAPSGARIAAGDDLLLVRALLAGRDPIIPALEIIRARVGAGDISFVPVPDSSAGAGRPATPAGGHAAPVTLAAPGASPRVLGWLHSPTLDPAGLRPHAEWMALWLALVEQQAALRQAAMVDDLTGAYNRRYFERYLQQAIEHAQRQRQSITLMVFDIDEFKSFNDRFGHSAGDFILREVVRLLRSVIRPTDRVCRIGGDEFAVVFYDAAGPRDPSSRPPEDPQTIARRFQQQIREHRFPSLGESAPGSLTVSAGLATYPWDGRSVSELLERADQFALQSKRAGKNAIRMGPGTEASGASGTSQAPSPPMPPMGPVTSAPPSSPGPRPGS
ncbi:MAG: diguanylate cyclase [Phycisphaerales bacterium]